jgi:hypothetical protein
VEPRIIGREESRWQAGPGERGLAGWAATRNWAAEEAPGGPCDGPRPREREKRGFLFYFFFPFLLFSFEFKLKCILSFSKGASQVYASTCVRHVGSAWCNISLFFWGFSHKKYSYTSKIITPSKEKKEKVTREGEKRGVTP